MNFDIGTLINLEKLIESRLLIQANSGGGKSYAIRKLLEETNGKVQQIILDLEGEFFSLREKFDFIVFGSEGDYPIHIKYADKMARTLLEHNVSAIVDLYELKHHERILFVRRFLESMINAPKELWHPCIVIIDEAHIFAPEKGNAESMNSVIDLCTRGRKRGYCAVLATQRLSKLHKDAAAECNNKLIGRTGLDVDMKRAGDELGFTSKSDMLSLRDLQAGEFFVFGPAISNVITKIKITRVKTTHPETGSRLMKVPPASSKIKSVLSQFKDLPQEAEKELRTESELKNEITSLRTKLTIASKQNPVVDSSAVNQLKIENKKLSNELNSVKKINERLPQLEKTISDAGLIFNNAITELSKFKSIKLKPLSVVTQSKPIALSSSARIAKGNNLPFIVKEAKNNNDSVSGGAKRMLKAAAMFYPNSISKARMGTIAGLSFKSGSFGTYLATLKRNGLIEGEGNNFTITNDGLQEAGDVDQLPNDPDYLVQMWCDLIKGGAARMLKVLAESYPNSMTREDLWTSSGLSNSGSFGTYLATLKRNGLIINNGGTFKASDELFGQEENKN